jgi:hypothetical protein
MGNPMMLKILSIPSLLILSLVLAGCNNNPTINTKATPKVVEGSELYPLENARVDTAYVDPKADFTRYTSIYLTPIDYSELKIIQPSNLPKSREFSLTAADKSTIDAIYISAMSKQLSADYGYRMVTIPEPRTLIVATKLIELRPNATNESKRDESARSKVYSEGSGDMTISADFKDGKSNNIIATIKDRKKSTQMWGQNTVTSNQRDIQLFFSSWGRALRDRLDTLNKAKDAKLNR